MKPLTRGSTAVMARRHAEPPDALDFFPSPPWGCRAGAELLKEVFPDARTVGEPACGEGHMASVLGEYFEEVFASDVFPYGYGETADFLDLGLAYPEVDLIVTNPPFLVAERFARVAVGRARLGVALLLRLSFLETQERSRFLYVEEPLTILAPFTERLAMARNYWNPTLKSATAYAWFIWKKGAPGPAIIRPLMPGTKERFTRLADLEFAAYPPAPPAAAPLFDAPDAGDEPGLGD